jgi:DNA-binding NarL/FixJ family response regulator
MRFLFVRRSATIGSEMIGGEASRASVLAVLSEINDGPAGVLIEAEPGAGKSTLWQWAVDSARQRGVRVLSARPVEPEARLPYVALGDVLEPLREAALPVLPAPQRRALEVTLLLADADDPPPDQRAIGVAVLGAIRRLVEAGPLVLAVDDLQWLDSDSKRILTFAIRRLTVEPVLLMLARRREANTDVPLGLDALPDSRVMRVAPTPLTLAELHQLVRQRLGMNLAGPMLARVHRASGGNPLYGLEIARLVIQRGGDQSELMLPLPDTLREAVGKHLGRLSESARQALVVVAALAQPHRDLVASMSQSMEDGLDEAIAAGVIEAHGASVRFSHPLFSSVAYSSASSAERRRLHRRLAALLDDPEERAAHVALGADAPDAGLSRSVANAARAAATRGASLAALELAGHARRLATQDMAAERSLLVVEAADFAFAAGDVSQARALLEESVTAEDTTLRAHALARLAMLETYDGSMVRARDVASQALVVSAEEPALRIAILRRLALAHLLLAELDPSERHSRAALELAEATADRASAARTLSNLAYLHAMRGRDDEARAALERALALESEPGLASIDDSPSAIAGLVHMYLGEFDQARRYLKAALERAQHQGGDPVSTGLLFALSELESRTGNFRVALAVAERGLAACEQSGQSTERSVLLYTQALAAAHLGMENIARRAADEGFAVAKGAAHRYGMAQNGWARGALELGLGRAEPAWNALSGSVLILRDSGTRPEMVPAQADAIEAALVLGRLKDAQTLVEQLEQGRATRWLEAIIARARGLIHAGSGEHDAAVAALNEAVEAHRRMGLEFELGRSLMALGGAMRRSKQRGAARQYLEEASECFSETGAMLWRERARMELRRFGGRTSADRDELTETEKRIAELAAEGLSNREIAAALFVAERTVESNLTRVYRKLGLRTRTQLAHRLPAR